MKSPLPPNPWWIRQKPPRAPAWLWPTVGALSMGAHGLLLGWVRAVIVNPGQTEDRSGEPVPIQLVDPSAIANGRPATSAESQLALPPAQPESAAEPAPTVAAPNSSPPADVPEAAPSPGDSSAPEDVAPRSAVEPAPSVQPPPEQPAPAVEPAPSVQPPPMPAPASPRLPTPEPAAPATAPSASSVPAAEPTPSTARPPGQVVPLAIRRDPNGRDLPDTLPQLESGSAIWIEPFLSGCGAGNLAALAEGRVGATVQMRLTVETNGQISAVTMLQGSGDPAFDQLAACVVQRGLRLQPASSDGMNQPTDAVILEAQIQL